MNTLPWSSRFLPFPASQTSLTLLSQFRRSPHDGDCWDQFVRVYGPRIQHWCLGWGLQPSDAEDVTQDVLLAMARQMKDFEYDPKGRFRSWLKTIAHRAWVDFLDRRRRAVPGSASEAVNEMLTSVEVQENFLDRMAEECERGLLEEAMLTTRRRVEPKTWQAFEMSALEGVSGSEIAKKLNMPITAVYKAKSRIQAMLKEEIESLDQTSISS